MIIDNSSVERFCGQDFKKKKNTMSTVLAVGRKTVYYYVLEKHSGRSRTIQNSRAVMFYRLETGHTTEPENKSPTPDIYLRSRFELSTRLHHGELRAPVR